MKDHPYTITIIAIILVTILVVIFDGGSGSNTASTPQTTIPTEIRISPSEEAGIGQNEREAATQNKAIEHEVEREQHNAHTFAKELEER